MKKFITAAMMTLFASAGANAAVSLSSTAGPWSGPGFASTAIFEFESADAAWNGVITTGTTSGVHAAPWQDATGYASVGGSDGTNKILDLSSFGVIQAISLYWGSVDGHNKLELLDAANNVLATFTGTQVIATANGSQTTAAYNRNVLLSVSGSDQYDIAKLRFSASSNAFEFDHVAVLAPVPEPATWGMMILGLGIVGGAMRRSKARIAFA